MEVDATLVEDALETDSYKLSTMGGVITKLKLLMRGEFNACNISLCNRTCNRLAHTLWLRLVVSLLVGV